MTLFWNFELFRFQECKKKQLWPTTGITGGDLATAGTVVVRGAGHGPRGPLRPAPGPGLARHRWFGCFWRTRAPRASGRAGSERGCGGAPDSGETRERLGRPVGRGEAVLAPAATAVQRRASRPQARGGWERLPGPAVP